MNKEIIEGLSNVIRGLGNIEVKGKANLLNLGGCIAILEELQQKCVAYMAQPKQGDNEKALKEKE